MAVAYQPAVIQRHINGLYVQANLTIAVALIIGAGGGYFAGLLVGGAVRHDSPLPIILTVVCAVIGLLVGLVLANALRLKAQLIKCQMQIEENTRLMLHHVTRPAYAPPPPVAGYTPPQMPR